MMHIAFLSPEYPHLKVQNAAGIGTSNKNLANALINKGCLVTLFVYGQKQSEIIVENGIRIHLIQDRKYAFGKWFFYRKHIQNYVNNVIINEKIDIVEAPDWTGITAFMNLKVPLVIRFHGSDTYFCHLECREQKLKNYWFEKLALHKAKAFIAPTDFAGNLTKKLFRIQNKKIITIPNGVELDKFRNQNPDEFQKGLILYMGTLIRKKGVLELPKILKLVLEKIPESMLVLIGSDSSDVLTKSTSTWSLMKEEMDSSVLDKMEYLGRIPYQEVQSYIEKAHVCVFPTFAETQGMVTIEAMAMQKPVVNSDIGWSKELIVDGESGFLVNPAKHQEFADRIIELFSNPDSSKKIGKNARKRVEDVFDIDKIAQKNIDFYKTIIN